ncbi:MAG: prepilin-type N-terminal cleavage/methylation domain-containing protein, partial [Candidatus Paceibacteria bacterium]
MMMQKNKGITLIELVISISIFTLILGAYGAFQNDIFS